MTDAPNTGDQSMDARLRAAGERWRAETDTASTVDAAAATETEIHELSPHPEPRRLRRGWAAWVSAAAAVAAVAVGIGFLVGTGNDGNTNKHIAAPETAATLYGTSWTLTRITDANGKDVSVVGDASLAIDGKGDVTGNAACNGYGSTAPVKVDASTVTFGDLASTAIGCMDGRASTESAIFAVYDKPMTWTIAGNTLTLRNSQGELDFTSADTALTGRDWHLRSIADANGNLVTASGSPTLRIDGTQLTVNDCSTQKANVTINGNVLRVGALSSSGVACHGEPVHVSAEAILSGDLTFQISTDGGTLTLTGTNGTLTYTAKQSASGTDPSQLLGDWTLTSYEKDTGNSGTGTGSNDLGSTISFTDGHIRIAHACYVNKGDTTVGSGTLDVSNVTLEEAIPCASGAGSPYDSDVDDVLTGSSTWTLDQGDLTITKGGVKLGFNASTTGPGGPQVSGAPVSTVPGTGYVGPSAGGSTGSVPVPVNTPSSTPDGPVESGGTTSSGGTSGTGGTGTGGSAGSVPGSTGSAPVNGVTEAPGGPASP